MIPSNFRFNDTEPRPKTPKSSIVNDFLTKPIPLPIWLWNLVVIAIYLGLFLFILQLFAMLVIAILSILS